MLLFNIQRFSTHDGPGIRTTVFFKGCPLKCAWCHNPESQSREKEILYNPERCTLCGRCVEVCPCGAVEIKDGVVVTDREKCTGCGLCAEECPGCARELAGREYTETEAMDVIVRDKTFYGESGGGVTFSGGECLCAQNADALLGLLKSCKRVGIHTAVDTSGACTWETLEKTLPHTDLYLYDIKCIDPQKHRRLVGADNAVILENLRRLKAAGAVVWLRLPLVEGANCADEDILPLVELADEIRPQRVSLLAYHDTGNFKYQRLNRAYTEFAAPSMERLDEIKHLFEAKGLEVKIGG